MNSTTKTKMAELQHARRPTFSSALSKLSREDRRQVNEGVDNLYEKLHLINPKINRTDILRCLAAIGAFSALLDPNYGGSS